MVFRLSVFLILIVFQLAANVDGQPRSFVSVKGHTFQSNNSPYYFVGANYWYGGLLGLEKDKKRGVPRLRRELVISRKNKYSGRKYTDDPTIMAWELANEPRPMRPYANDDYKRWIADTAAMIKTLDKKHRLPSGMRAGSGRRISGFSRPYTRTKTSTISLPIRHQTKP